MQRASAPRSLELGNGFVELLETDSGEDVIRLAGAHQSPMILPVSKVEDLIDVVMFLLENALNKQLS